MSVARRSVSKSKRSSVRFPSRFLSRIFGEPVETRRSKRTILGVESLESRWLMATLPDPVVTFHTNQGDLTIELFAQTQPVTVENFLNYINDGDYDGSFFHRSAVKTGNAPFVIQGGGFSVADPDDPTFIIGDNTVDDFSEVFEDDPIVNEPGRSNVRGTVAMAKLGGDPDSATNQFFVNLSDNSSILDTQNGGFTVFGQVINNTMTTADAIAALPRKDLDPSNTDSAFHEVPLSSSHQLVVMNSITGNGFVTGTVFRDVDQNGTLDDGEDGLSGITVFADDNDNSILDAGEISTTTDADGKYLLTVPSGDHTIRQLPANSFVSVDPDGLDVTVDIGLETADNDFGDAADIFAAYTVQVTHADGSAVTAAAPITVGEQFKVNVFVQDPQPNTNPATTQVLTGAVNLTFDPTLASFLTVTPNALNNPSGVDVTFGPKYSETNTTGVGESTAGSINGVVASSSFSDFLAHNFLGDQTTLMFSVNMKATAAGSFSFATTPAVLSSGIKTNVADDAKPGLQYEPTNDEISAGEAEVNVVSILAATDDSLSARVNSSNNTLNVLANDIANPAGTLNIDSVSATSVAGGVVHVADDHHSLIYTPLAGFTGTDTLTYTLSDGTGAPTVTGHVTVSVHNLPAANADTFNFQEDSGAHSLDVLTNDQANTGHTNTITAVGTTPHGTVTIVGGTTLSYTPAANFAGVDTFTYTITDGTGVNDVGTVTVNVANVSDNPTATADTATTAEETAATIDVLANDFDVDNQPQSNTGLTVTAVTQGAHGTVTIIASGADAGKLSYTPALNYFGPDSFSYTISDPQNNTATGTVNVTVNNVNDAPSAVADAFTTFKNAGVTTFTVLANDFDVDNQPQSNSGLTVSAITQGAHGTVAISSGGTSVTYQPSADFTGSDSFTYTVQDAGGLTSQATVTMTIADFIPSTLSGFVYLDASGDGQRQTTELPVAGVTITLTGSGGAAGVTATKVTASDGSYQFTNLAPGSYTIAEAQPPFLAEGVDAAGSQGGTALVKNQIVFDLAQGTTGIDNNFGERGLQAQFVRLSDFFARRATQSVFAALNSSATPVWFSATSGWSNVVSATATLINNNTQVQLDVTTTSGDVQRTVISTTDTSHLRIRGTSNGLTLVQILGSFSDYTFTPVNVTNHAPVAVNDVGTTGNGTPLNVAAASGVLANDTDADTGDVLVVSAVNGAAANVNTQLTLASGALLTLKADGSYTYDPNGHFASLTHGQTATDSFTYTVSDGHDGTATATVTITITGPNTAPAAVNDTGATNQNTPLTVSASGVLSNDTDVDGDALVVSAVNGTAASVGTQVTLTSGALLTLGANGGYTYNPNGHFNSLAQGATATDTFTYTASDGNGGTATGTVTITITGLNDAPTAADDTLLANIGTATTKDVLANDTDVDNNPLSNVGLTVTAVTQGAHGTVAIITTGIDAGKVSYTPAAGFSGSDTFTYTIQDPQGATATGSVHVTVSNPPIAVDDAFTVNEDSGVNLVNVLANDTDADNSPLSNVGLTVTAVVQGTHGAVNIVTSGPDTGKVSYTPAANFFGTDTFTYTIHDPEGHTATGHVTITVTSVPDAPAAVDDNLVVDVGVPATIDVLANDTDADNDPPSNTGLTVSAVTQGAHGTVAIITTGADAGKISYTPAAGFSGADTFTYTVSDPTSLTATGTVHVTVSNPPVAVDDTLTVNEDSGTTAIAVLANDTDADNSPLSNVGLTVTGVTQGAHGTVAIITTGADAGKVSYTPAANFFGTDSFTYEVGDPEGHFSSATVNVTVNAVPDDPTAVVDTVIANEDEAKVIKALDNDFDADNQPQSNVGLTITAVTQGAHGAVSIIASGPDAGRLLYTPAGNFFGTDTFTYTITDATSRTATGTVNVTVQGTPDDPTAVDDVSSTLLNAPVTVDVLANDSDADNQPLSNAGLVVFAVTNGAHGTVEVLTGGPDAGQPRYTPDVDFVGLDTFTYTVTDPEGNHATATVRVAVLSGPGAPTAVDDDLVVSIDTPATIDVLANDFDVDNVPLSNAGLTVTGITPGTSGTVEIVASGADAGKVKYTPNAGFTGTDSFTYTISDGQSHTATATVHVIVSHPPTAVDDAFTIDEDSGENALDVLANDTDADNDPLSNAGLSVTSVTSGTHGAVAIITSGADAGKISYTPAVNFFGADSFTYTIRDTEGHSATATVNVTITAVQHDPTAVADDVSANEDEAKVVRPIDNDFDVDNDPSSNVGLTATAVTQGAHGTVEIIASGPDAGQLLYTPEHNFFGADTFTYTVTDSTGRTATGTVNMTVLGVPDDPTAVDDFASTLLDTPVTIDLLANDSDVDNQPLSNAGLIVFAVTQGAHGTVEVLTGGPDAGKPRYTPDAGFVGLDSFTYTVADAEGNHATATVQVAVLSEAGAPTAVDDAADGLEDGTVVTDVLANDFDLDNVPRSNTGLTVTAVTQGAHGAVEIVTTGADAGKVSYTPAAGFFGTDTFTYTISDGDSRTATATVTVAITHVNHSPTATADTGATDEDSVLTVLAAAGVLVNDTDVDAGDVPTITEVNGVAANVGTQITLASGALLTLNADGSYVYDPNGKFETLGAGATGSDSFAYTVSDGHGGTATATVSLTINGVNDAPLAANDAGTTDKDTVLTISAALGLLQNDSDVDAGDVLAVSEVNGVAAAVGTQITLTSGALLTVGADGGYTYDPNGQFASLTHGQASTDSFSYAVSDGQGGTATATVTLTILGPNNAPTATDDSGATDENTLLIVTAGTGLLDNDTDVDAGDVLTVAKVNGLAANVGTQITLASGALLTVNADGSYTYDPNAKFESLGAGATASDSFTYTVSDGNGGTATATVSLTISGVNDGPLAVADAGTTDEDSPLTVVTASGLLQNDTDVDAGDVLTVSEVNGSAANVGTPFALASGAVLTVNADGSYTYDPHAQFESLGAGATGSDSFTYTVSDGNGGTATATVSLTITGVNDAPIGTADTGTTDEDSVLTVLAAAGVLVNDSDVDAGDALTVTEVNGVAANVGTQITLASGALLTLNSDGNYVYDPNAKFESLGAGATGSDSFAYTVSDGHGGTATATVSLTINGVNDAPLAANDAGTTDKDTVLTISAALGLLQNDSDVDAGDVLAVSEVNGVAAAVGTQITLTSGALLTVGADGGYTYDPNGQFASLTHGQASTDSFSYAVSDGQGGTATATVTLTILGPNDAPTAVADAGSTDEDSVLTVLAASGVLQNDTDVDAGDVLTVSAVNGLAANVGTQITLASGALLTVNADGSYTYDPNAKFESLGAGATASDSFTYTVSDGNGGTSTATVSLTISGVNDGPLAVADAGTTDEDSPLTVVAVSGLLQNDTDVDAGDVLTVSEVNGSAANVGTPFALASGAVLTVNSDGSYTYDPHAQFESLGDGANGSDSFTYTVSDGNGGTATATVSLTITGVNDAPIGTADTGTTGEDSVLTVLAAAGVLVNDSDVDAGDALTVTEVNGVAANVGTQITLASGALLTLNSDGNYVYDPNGQFQHLKVGESDTDSFTYTVSDGKGGLDIGTVTITINGANDAPTAGNDAGTTDEDTVLTVAAAAGLLANDSDVDAGDALTVTEVNGVGANVGTQITLASGAFLTLNADGSYLYDPNGKFESLGAGATGSDSFAYTVSDGQGGTATATVSLTITGVNDPPLAVNDAGTTDEDTILNSSAGSNVLQNDTDADAGDTPTVTEMNGLLGNVGTQVSLASGAVVVLNADGSYTYDPNGKFENLAVGESTTDSFTYTMSDGHGGTSTATVTITITGVNDVPAATDDTDSIGEDAVLTAPAASGVLHNDTDPDTSDTLTVSQVNGSAANVGTQIALASGALLTLNADGSYVYDPNGKFESLGIGESGTDSFTYAVSDGHGGTSTATATITIDGQNDAPTAVDDVDDVMASLTTGGNVLPNDTDPDLDDILTVIALNSSGPSVGVPTTLTSGALVTLNANGTYTYDPNHAFDGLASGSDATDFFDYDIDDGHGGTDTGRVNITIHGG